MNFILFDGPARNALLPFTFTRPVGALRIGILTIQEKWDKLLNAPCSFLTEPYLQEKYPLVQAEHNILINAKVLPNPDLAARITQLEKGNALVAGDTVIAYSAGEVRQEYNIKGLQKIQWKEDLICIENTWDIFALNGQALEMDFQLLTKGRKSVKADPSAVLINPGQIFLEEGAKVRHCILNAENGPIYIGKDAEVMEGSIIRGGFALGEGSTVKMGAKIYGPTTAGPFCKIGGEVSNSVLMGYSNKGHDGFLGNSVLGEWCNLGADTNTSNLKNNYAKVRLWNYDSGRFDQTGLQFCGLIMGDHSKTAINTMLNTGTVVGVNSNVYSVGFPRNFIPSFSWGGGNAYSTYTTAKAFDTAKVVMERRGVEFNIQDRKILEEVFKITQKWRSYK